MTPALAPPPCETSASATSASNTASAAQEPAAKGSVPMTTPGTCLVCLADSEEMVGAAWLHRKSTVVAVTAAAAAAADDGGGEAGCTVSACVSCLKTYFEVSLLQSSGYSLPGYKTKLSTYCSPRANVLCYCST